MPPWFTVANAPILARLLVVGFLLACALIWIAPAAVPWIVAASGLYLIGKLISL